MTHNVITNNVLGSNEEKHFNLHMKQLMCLALICVNGKYSHESQCQQKRKKHGDTLFQSFTGLNMNTGRFIKVISIANRHKIE